MFENATKQFSVPRGLFKSGEGRDLLAAHCPLKPVASNLSINDPSYYDQTAMDETRNRNRAKADKLRAQGAAYSWSRTDELRLKADEIYQRSKPVTETPTEPEQVEKPKSNSNGGGDAPVKLTKEEKREKFNKLYGRDRFSKVQLVKKSGFGNAKSEETKAQIRQDNETRQMDLFDWSEVVEE